MTKVKVQCTKCKKVWQVEISPNAFDNKTGLSFQEMRCPYCGAWVKMKRKY
jgi:endogenous inhibitor of DNA gyrase (YacG/DUF329 family)